ncbi:alpha/beta hydrolase [Kibdelosporangium persicum]|uniref:Pimeloyl-ACP methyl ester carboxylesterase n=1 Tax=Kibdelosporangium persicum TaxID=2698649 RepID=A0ABX2FKX0_9PSEU|nr:alpha/beta hydrolase [Kibdelosporangium persicum]NRN71370.1 Pimeloyl-ACP methyl ester carboxylesterase [Kibdelosporangium persicum]
MRWFHSGQTRALARRCLALTLVCLGVGFLTTPTQAQPTRSAAAASCQDVYFPVTLTLVPQRMYGKLCVPEGGARTVHVMIPGGTYNSSYWDIGFEPETRSYRRAMNDAGYATLALDRLGTGRSTVPLSLLLTAITEAEVVHEVVQQLRSGAQGPRFDKIILGGHSFGSGVAIIEAATFRDVDGVLVTGLAHRINALGAAAVFAATLPVPLDPKFSRTGHDLAYITTLPGTRYDIFHKPGPKIDGAIAYDETTKDTSVHTQAVDLFPVAVILPYSRLIDVPVMVALGQDSVFCGALATDCSSGEAIKLTESLYYSAAADLHAYALPGYGHVINYAPNAPQFFRAVEKWADRKVGR